MVNCQQQQKMSHLHVQNLIKKASKMIPQMQPALNKFRKNNSIIINYPLSLQQKQLNHHNKLNRLVSNQLIGKNNYIYLVDSNQIFTSSNFVGATKNQERILNKNLEQLKQKYEVFTEEILTRMKITASIIANSLDQEMDLHLFAKFIKTQKPSLKIQNWFNHTSSGFLKSLVGSSKISVQTAFSYLHEDMMRQIKLQDFNSFYQSATFASRETHKIKVLFPFSTNFSHSFEPNCQLSTLYLTHRRQLFLTIKSTRQIKQNQLLTLNYGINNNYEFLVKYGFAVENNPYSQFYLALDYSQIDEIFNQCIQDKMQLLKYQANTKLKNIVRINIHGKIEFSDLKMLRIIFLTQNFDRSSEFIKSLFQQKDHPIDLQVYEFVKKVAKASLQLVEYMSNVKKLKQEQSKKNNNKAESFSTSSDKKMQMQLKSIKTIQEEEIKILRKILE